MGIIWSTTWFVTTISADIECNRTDAVMILIIVGIRNHITGWIETLDSQAKIDTFVSTFHFWPFVAFQWLLMPSEPLEASLDLWPFGIFQRFLASWTLRHIFTVKTWTAKDVFTAIDKDRILGHVEANSTCELFGSLVLESAGRDAHGNVQTVVEMVVVRVQKLMEQMIWNWRRRRSPLL